MKKNFKRALSCLLAIIMCICAVPMGDIGVTANAAGIPSDAVEFNGHYYKVIESQASWKRAKQYCENLNGHLVTIENEDENKFVSDLMISSKIYPCWLGATDEFSEGNFKWVTGENFAYTKWGSGEPNGNMWSREDYIEIFNDGLWNDCDNDTYANPNYGEWAKTKGYICEWESGKKFPDGYNFDRDRYSFDNIDETIDKKYYQSEFGLIKGLIIHNKQESGSNHGHCFGMACSTSAILQNSPNISTYSVSNLINIDEETTYNSNMLMTAKEYIKYCHIYQFSDNVATSRKNASNLGINNVYNAVKAGLSSSASPIIIDMWANFGGHTVYAIGIEGNDILVNDSNEPNRITKIIKKGDSWEYTGGGWHWDSANGDTINYVSGTTVFYNCLMNDLNDFFSYHKLLVAGSSNLTYKESNSLTEIKSTSSLSNNVQPQNNNIYWLDEGNTINVENNSIENSEIQLAGNELEISATLPKDSSTEIQIDENGENDISIDNAENKTVEVTFTTVSDDELLDLKVAGHANSTVTATQTETGLNVTGISDGTVTLSKDDEVISAQKITDAVSDIDITYDKDGSTGKFDVDYDAKPCDHYYVNKITKEATCTTDGVMTYTCSTCGDTYTETIPATGHIDTDSNGICDNCGKDLTENCTHICHKGGFSGFIYKIVRVFWKLFKINQTCSCGKKHY